MNEKQKIEDRVRKKRTEIVQIEEKLKAAKVYISALTDVLKMLEGDGDPPETADSKLRPGSAMAQARDIILARGEPVHLDERQQGREQRHYQRARKISRSVPAILSVATLGEAGRVSRKAA